MRNSNNISELRRSMERLVLDRVIPNLVERVSASEKAFNVASQSSRFSQFEIERFSKIVLENNYELASAKLNTHLREGHYAQTLILDLLGGSANLLGEKWVNDECSFADVTLGMTLLHRLLKDVTPRLSKEMRTVADGEKIIFAAMPGDTHIFPVCLLETFFNASGWKAESVFDVTAADILKKISRDRPLALGLSVSCSSDLQMCEAIIAKVREIPVDIRPKIIVGGYGFDKNLDTAFSMGADSFANNAIEALDITYSYCKRSALFDVVS